MQQQFDQIIDRHFRFEAEDDIDGVLGTMVEGVEHDVVGYPTGPVRGKAAARGFYENMFADLSGEKVTTLRRYYGPNFVVDESLWEGTAPGSPFGMPGHGRRLAFRLLHIFDMAPDGQILRENVWLDFAAIQSQLNAPLKP
ncbi:MAG: nuclear transport factor 2 family protein [Telluria sp.]